MKPPGPAVYLLLPLVCVLAFQARARLAPPEEVVDPGTAAHLRGIELTLARGSAPSRDRFLDPPRGAGAPDSPFVDAAYAAVARLFLGDSGGSAALDGVVEEDLERFAGRGGAWFAALTALALFLAVHALGGSPGRALAAILAGLLFALAPSAVRAGAAGRVDPGALHALFAAFTFTTAAQLSIARQGFDLLQGGLTAGLVVGLGLLGGPAALVYAPFAWAAAWLVVRRARFADDRERAAGDRELAALAAQAGLFLALVAAVVSTLAGGQLGRDGLAGAWLRGASELCFVLGIPFLALSLASRRDAPRARRAGLAVGGIAVVLLLPLAGLNLWRALGPRVAAAARDADPLAVLAGAPSAWLAALAIPAAAALARRGGGPALGLAAATAALALAGAACAPGLLPVLAASAAFLAGLVFDDLVRRDALRFAAPAAVTALAVFAWRGVLVPPRAHDATAERQELVEALRWMRDGTPSPGPWNAAGSPKDYSVLAPWTFGHLVAYHARRPPLVSGHGTLVAELDARGGMALYQERDPAALAEGMRRRGALYVVAGAAACDEWDDVARLSGRDVPLAESVVWKLSTLVPDGAPEARHFTLERAWGAREVELDGDRYTVPNVALYRLARPPLAGEFGPRLRSR